MLNESLDNDREDLKESTPQQKPQMVLDGLWLISRLKQGGQSGIFLSLVDTDVIPIPESVRHFEPALVKSFDFDDPGGRMYQAFFRELKILESMPDKRSPLLHAWESESKGRILMRQIPGPTLESFSRSIARTKKRLPLPFAILLARDLFADLALIHALYDRDYNTQGELLRVVHRDVSPQNIIVDTGSSSRNVVRLIDFGISTINQTPKNPEACFPFGLGRGSYLSPEELTILASETAESTVTPLPNRPVCDIYAASLVVAGILIGESARQGDFSKTGRGIDLKIVNDEKSVILERIEQSYGDLPTPFLQVLANGLAYHPEDRYANGLELSDAWETAIYQANLKEILDVDLSLKLTERLKQYAAYLHRSEEADLQQKWEAAVSALTLK